MTEDTNKEGREQQRIQLNELLNHILEILKTQAQKVTIPDLIRLMQFAREIDSTETPREVKVTWVEHTRSSETEE